MRHSNKCLALIINDIVYNKIYFLRDVTFCKHMFDLLIYNTFTLEHIYQLIIYCLTHQWEKNKTVCVIIFYSHTAITLIIIVYIL